MAPALLPRTVYAGTFIHLFSRTELLVRENAIVGVDPCGRIEFICERYAGGKKSVEEVEEEWIETEVERQGWGGGEGKGWVLKRAGRGELWFPGFVGEFGFFKFFIFHF